MKRRPIYQSRYTVRKRAQVAKVKLLTLLISLGIAAVWLAASGSHADHDAGQDPDLDTSVGHSPDTDLPDLVLHASASSVIEQTTAKGRSNLGDEDHPERTTELALKTDADESNSLEDLEPDHDTEDEDGHSDGHTAKADHHQDSTDTLEWHPNLLRPVPIGIPGLHPDLFEEVDGRMVQHLPNGDVAITTIDPALQRAAENTVAPYPVPYAAIVALEPATGKVLALVSKSTAEPDSWDLPMRPCAPSASVFKIITMAALLEHAEIDPEEEICYHGGLRRLTSTNILGCPRRDNRCNPLTVGISHSANSMVAKLTHAHLDENTLLRTAQAFGYNQHIPFDLPTMPSPITLPDDDRLEFARAAAGFWHSDLSAVHGALIAAAVANEGVMMQPYLVDWIASSLGDVMYQSRPMVMERSTSPETAKVLTRMMEATVRSGTGRRSFQRWPRRWDISVAGKTGSLVRRDPWLDYSWFIAFAPADNPEIAVAAMVANEQLWHVRAPTLARQVLFAYFRAQELNRNQSKAASQ